jgi:DNA primase
MSLAQRDEAVEAVRLRTDIVGLIGRYLKLKKVGNRYVGLCPFHAEKTPSFSVSPQKGFFHCFGCRVSGDAFSFLMRMEAKSFPEALQELAEQAGVELPDTRSFNPLLREKKQRHYDLLERCTSFFENCLSRGVKSKEALGYLALRGFDLNEVKGFRLGFAPGGWHSLTDQIKRSKLSMDDAKDVGLVLFGDRGPFDMFRNRLMFPIIGLDDKVHGFGGRKLDPEEKGAKYINSPQGAVYDKSSILYGLAQARRAIQQNSRVVLVEGYFDVLSMVGAGIREVVATSGTALTESHVRIIKRFSDCAVLVFDADEAGFKASVRAAELLLAQDISPFMVSLPAGDDPDSFVRQHGGEEMSQRICQARPAIEILSDRILAETPGDVESRTRAVRHLYPILKACFDSVRFGNYLRLVADRFSMNERDLRRALKGNVGVKTPKKHPRVSPVAQLPIPEDEINLMVLLLQFPRVARQTSLRGLELNFKSEILRDLFLEMHAATEELSPAFMMEQISDKAVKDRLAEKLLESDGLTEEQGKIDIDLCRRKIQLIDLQEHERQINGQIEQARRSQQQEELRLLLVKKLGIARELQELGLAVKRS